MLSEVYCYLYHHHQHHKLKYEICSNPTEAIKLCKLPAETSLILLWNSESTNRSEHITD